MHGVPLSIEPGELCCVKTKKGVGGNFIFDVSIVQINVYVLLLVPSTPILGGGVDWVTPCQDVVGGVCKIIVDNV